MSEKINLKYFKNLFEFFSEPLLIVNKSDLKVLYCNSEFQNLTNKSSKYILNNSLEDIFSFDLFFLSNIKDVLNKQTSFIIKDRVKLNDDEYEVKCIVEDAHQSLMTLFFMKVPNENKFNLVDKNIKFLNDTLAILGHEISNPITTIKIATDLIKKENKLNDYELLDIIKKEANRIVSIFDNFQVFNNKVQTSEEENIHEIIRYSLIKFSELNETVQIVELFDPSLPNLKINRDLLIQVFDNIFKNCYEALNLTKSSFIKIITSFKEGESIKIPNINKKKKNNYLNIKIIDNGKGIDPETKDKLFFPFYTTKKKGSGIGLFLVKKIINDHQGNISIKSKNDLTEVVINLPI